MVTFAEPYVERVERALVETVILSELAERDDRPVDELVEVVLGIEGWSEDADADLVENLVRRLDRDGHVERDGDRVRITADGRDDVRRMQTLLCNVTTGVAPERLREQAAVRGA